jgi:hypothetical protein
MSPGKNLLVPDEADSESIAEPMTLELCHVILEAVGPHSHDNRSYLTAR